MIYKNQTIKSKEEEPRYGSWSGVKLDTLDKAETYIRWQYQQGLITNAEMMDNLKTARAEFNGQEEQKA